MVELELNPEGTMVFKDGRIGAVRISAIPVRANITKQRSTATLRCGVKTSERRVFMAYCVT